VTTVIHPLPRPISVSASNCSAGSVELESGRRAARRSDPVRRARGVLASRAVDDRDAPLIVEFITSVPICGECLTRKTGTPRWRVNAVLSGVSQAPHGQPLRGLSQDGPRLHARVALPEVELTVRGSIDGSGRIWTKLPFRGRVYSQETARS
jgi:hypothetical protein